MTPIDTQPPTMVELRAGRRIALRRRPAAAGAATLVLCHGAGGRMDQWRRVWDGLAAAGYGLVAWDLLGHGASARPRGAAPYAGGEMVADLRALVDRYGGARTTVVGHSYGARLALAAFAQGDSPPAQVERLALLGSPAPQAPFAGALLHRWPACVLAALRPLLARGFRTMAWHPQADRALVAAEEAAADRNLMRVFKPLTTLAPTLAVEHLAGFTRPVLLLSGADDRLAPPAGAAALAALLPAATLRLLPCCGHQVMLEQPEATRRVLQDFVGPAGPP